MSDERLYTAAEAAVILRCSSWWIKEKARQRRIPFSWIGGSYRFSEEHLSEIVRIFEVLPDVDVPAAATPTSSVGRRAEPVDDVSTPAVRLTAKPPRRSRRQPDAA